MEAAPPAPARPEPTTITLYLRLLAGLTSFISKRCLLPLLLEGPGRDVGAELHATSSDYLTIPVSTAIGKEMLPTTTRTAKIQAAAWAMRM